METVEVEGVSAPWSNTQLTTTSASATVNSQPLIAGRVVVSPSSTHGNPMCWISFTSSTTTLGSTNEVQIKAATTSAGIVVSLATILIPFTSVNEPMHINRRFQIPAFSTFIDSFYLSVTIPATSGVYFDSHDRIDVTCVQQVPSGK
jgi:hypothetical protein